MSNATQMWPTICPHNGQTYPPLPGVGVRCRMCGCVLQPSTREVANGAWPTPDASPNLVIPSESALTATYPGQFDATSVAAAAAL
jgi:hypothetical protein